MNVFSVWKANHKLPIVIFLLYCNFVLFISITSSSIACRHTAGLFRLRGGEEDMEMMKSILSSVIKHEPGTGSLVIFQFTHINFFIWEKHTAVQGQ